MKWLRAFAPVLAALALAWLLGGPGSCEQARAPQLVRVIDLAPREVEPGDSVALVGEGFPAGKPARVTFRGTLHRPGERPVTGAEIVATGTVLGPERVELSVGDATAALFCGAADRATHTTFEGEIEVAFAAAAQGAPPVSGVLSGVTFDVRPGSNPSGAGREHEGDSLLSWLGVRVASCGAVRTAGSGGLSIEAVDPGSRAESSGLRAGDVITSFDGVRVESAGDVLPAPGEREASVGVRRAGAAVEVPRTVPVDGFRRAPPAELVGSALAVLAALAIVLFFCAPSPAAVSRWVHAAAERARARSTRLVGAAPSVRARPWSSLIGALSAVANRALPPAGPPAIVDAVTGALLAVMPFGQYLVASQLDVGILFVGAVTALATAALLGPIGGSSLHAARAFRAALHVLWQHVPGGVAVASVVLATGSLRIQEIERAQGGCPWDWLAFRSPAALVAFVLLLSCAQIEPDDPPWRGCLAPLVDDPRATGAASGRRGPWIEAACRAHRVVIAGLASALFLGGWLLPGVSPAAQGARPALELAGAALLLGKTGALVMLSAWARWVGPSPFLGQRSRETAIGRVPLSLVALLGAAAWDRWGPPRAAQLLMSGSLCVLVCLVAAALLGALSHALARGAVEGAGRGLGQATEQAPGTLSVFL